MKKLRLKPISESIRINETADSKPILISTDNIEDAFNDIMAAVEKIGVTWPDPKDDYTWEFDGKTADMDMFDTTRGAIGAITRVCKKLGIKIEKTKSDDVYSYKITH